MALAGAGRARTSSKAGEGEVVQDSGQDLCRRVATQHHQLCPHGHPAGMAVVMATLQPVQQGSGHCLRRQQQLPSNLLPPQRELLLVVEAEGVVAVQEASWWGRGRQDHVRLIFAESAPKMYCTLRNKEWLRGPSMCHMWGLRGSHDVPTSLLRVVAVL